MQLSLIPFSPVRAHASRTPDASGAPGASEAPEVSHAREGEPVEGDFFALLDAALVPMFAPPTAPLSAAPDTARPAAENTDDEQTAVWPATVGQLHFNFQTETIPESAASLSARAPLRSSVDTAIEKIDAAPSTLSPSRALPPTSTTTNPTVPAPIQCADAAPSIPPAIAQAESPPAVASILMHPAPHPAPTLTTMAQPPELNSLPNRSVLPRVGAVGWDQAMSSQVVWLARSDYQSASLHLNPPELGPLHVVLSLSDAGATASFSSAQPEVRLAIEAALPKLREMLGDAGLQLNNASVSSGQSEQRQENPSDTSARAASSPVQNSVPVSGAPAISVPSGATRGLVDTFA